MELSRLEYHIPCPYSECGAYIPLHETILEGIVQGLAKLTTDVGDITFQCPECKGIFVFERDRLPDVLAVSAPAVVQTEPRLSFLAARFCKSNCGVRRIVVAVRPAGETEEQLDIESRTWETDHAWCPNYHQIVPPLSFV